MATTTTDASGGRHTHPGAPEFTKRPCDCPGFFCCGSGCGRYFRVVVEGSIGAGKTTVLCALQKRGHPAFPEPLAKWKHLLPLAADKPSLHFEEMQRTIINAMGTRDEEARAAALGPTKSRTRVIQIFERHVRSSVAFINAAHEQGLVPKKTVDDLHELVKTSDHPESQADLFIFLAVSPEQCLDRIRRRGRKGEEDLNVDYLKDLSKRLARDMKETAKTFNIPVHVVDGAEGPEVVANAIEDIFFSEGLVCYADGTSEKDELDSDSACASSKKPVDPKQTPNGSSVAGIRRASPHEAAASSSLQRDATLLVGATRSLSSADNTDDAKNEGPSVERDATLLAETSSSSSSLDSSDEANYEVSSPESQWADSDASSDEQRRCTFQHRDHNKHPRTRAPY